MREPRAAVPPHSADVNHIARSILRGLMIILGFSASPPLTANDSAGASFSGIWRSRATTTQPSGLQGVTTLTLRQIGDRVCGEWAEGVGDGKLLGGNIVGHVRGRKMTAQVGEDIFWQKAGIFPRQKFDSALLVLQGRQLTWYARERSGRNVRQQVFARETTGPSAVSGSIFMDEGFARLCPAGTDFTSAHQPAGAMRSIDSYAR